MLNDTHRCLKTPFHSCALWIEHRLDLGQRSHFSSSVFLLFNLCTEMIKVQTVLFECCAAVSMNALIFRLPVLLGIIECFEEHHKSDHCPIISCRETQLQSADW